MEIVDCSSAGQSWVCPTCSRERSIPPISEPVPALEMSDVRDQGSELVDSEVRGWGEQICSRFRADNIGIASAQINEFFCIKAMLPVESQETKDGAVIEYLKMTHIEVEGKRSIHLSCDAGVITSSSQALKLLEYTTVYAKIHLEGKDVRLKWFLPLENLSEDLLYEVCLSLIFHASMIQSSILLPMEQDEAV
ncbi:MAG: hypothetical protein QF752_05560 [Planctomycetota bacterium]|jgi:hypothetical protein|nr:hypothetical protein [Planctomycetota bacterium]